MALASTAICLAGALAAPEHPACAMMEREAGTAYAGSDCCVGERTNFNATLSTALARELTPQDAPLPQRLGSDIEPAPPLAAVAALNADTHKPPGNPTYLLTSVFRI